MKSVSDLIKSKREMRKVSQAYMADQLSISERAYQNYESDREPKLETLRKIADILGVHVIELLDEQFVQKESSEGVFSLDKIAEKIDSVHSLLFGHVVRSGERFAKEDVKKSEAEMDRINRYAEQFLKVNVQKGTAVYSQGKV